ncbi:unnamed protein product [Brassica oleracea var. botrytis]
MRHPFGGYVMKIPFITFQIILFMRLKVHIYRNKSNIPIVVLFVPLFLLQGATVLFVTYTSVVKSVLWIYNVGGPYGRYLARSLARVFLRFFQHCKRCNTLSPEAVKKMPKSHLVEEVCRLKAALSEQTDSSQQEKNICKVCFEDPVNVVLFPCSHHVLCR